MQEYDNDGNARNEMRTLVDLVEQQKFNTIRKNWITRRIDPRFLNQEFSEPLKRDGFIVKNVMDLAVLGSDARIARMLDNKGAKISSVVGAKWPNTILEQVYSKGNPEMIKVLGMMGEVNMDSVDNNGDTLLHRALKENNFDVAEAIIACKPNLKIVNAEKESALHIAAEARCSQFLTASRQTSLDRLILLLLAGGSLIDTIGKGGKKASDIYPQILNNYLPLDPELNQDDQVNFVQ